MLGSMNLSLPRAPHAGFRGMLFRLVIVLGVLAFALLFQGSRGLWERDEGRYTGVALQMMDSGDYLVPAYNAEVPHLTKPPLTYWAIAGGMAVLGRNEWGARLPNGLAFAATLFVLLALGRRLLPDRPWLPPLIYGTSLLPFLGAHIVTTDTLLTLWEALAVLGFVAWSQRTQGRLLPLLLMWTTFGLAFLTKGPPGLLPLLAIVVFDLVRNGGRHLLRLFHPLGLAVFLLVGFGWYATVALARPGTLGYWLHDEVVARVASDLHHRNAQWYKAFLIYLPVLFFGCAPWIVPLLRGCRRALGLRPSREAWRVRLERDPWSVYLLLWFLLPLLVFFLSSSRLPLYVLPLVLPMSLALGRWVVLPLRRRVEIPLLALWVGALLVLKLGGAGLSNPMDSRALAREVAAAVHPAPKEILFVDTEPYWGLRLYLQCEVERADTSSSAQTGAESGEPLAEELNDAEPGSLMIIERKQETRILETCRKLGHGAQVVGGNQAWSFIRPF